MASSIEFPTWRLYLNALMFWVGLIISTLLFAPFSILLYPFPQGFKYRFITQWAHFNIFWLGLTCRIRYRVEGKENIPDGAAIALCKHQSTWETLALQRILPQQAWVLKRELLLIPFFGWGLAMLSPIAINRSAGRKAVEQLVDKGREKLDAGEWVVIFPEGTRVRPGDKKRYKLGGAVLASQVDYPIIPVAHNAGELWPKGNFIKYPGDITVVIGEPIHALGREPTDINEEVGAWIDAQMQRISRPELWKRLEK